MPLDIDPADLKKAIGRQVAVSAFGIPFVGKLVGFDEEKARLEIDDGEHVAYVEHDRIDQFEIVEDK